MSEQAATAIGVSAIFFGALLIVLSFRIDNLRKRIERLESSDDQ